MKYSKETNIAKLLFQSVKTEKKDLVIVFVYAIIIGLLYLVTPLAVQELVNIIAFGVVLQPLILLTILVGAGLFLAGLFRVLQRYLVEIIQQRLFVSTAFELVERIVRVQKHALGNKQINLFFEVLSLQKSYSKLLIDGLSAVLQATIGLIILGLYHPWFIILDFFLVFGICFVIFIGGRNGLKTSLTESHHKYDLIHWLQESGAAHDAFKLVGTNEFLLHKTDHINSEYINSRREHFGIVLKQNVMSLILQAIISCSLLGLGGLLVIEGSLTLGQLIAAELVVTSILAAIDKFIGQIEVVYDLLTALVKLDYLKSLPTDPVYGDKSLVHKPQGLAIESSKAGFSFPEGDAILQEITFSLKPSEWIAIKGSRGSGKSTLLHLLAKLFLPTKGSIYFDNQEIRDINDKSFGEHVSAIMGGRNLIFEGSLKDNILLGREEKLPLRQVLQVTSLDELVDNSPNGMAMQLDTAGSNLSESQVARLLFARALVSLPRLILVDEDSFGMLDTDLKHKILNSIQNNLPFKPSLVFFGEDNIAEEFINKSYQIQSNGIAET